MRHSLFLSLVSFVATFVYGFSTQPVVGGGRRLIGVSQFERNNVLTTFRGGSVLNNSNRKATTSLNAGPIKTESKCPVTGTAAVLASLWGSGGVLYILSKAIKRVLPIALEPFQQGSVPLTQFQLGAYVVTCLWFAYVEGYKGFQLKFSPMVVKRSFTLVPGRNGTAWFHYIIAPYYSMGMIHSTRKRKITSYSVTLGVAAIVAAVKKLPYPWRNIIDAGVVVGLGWGSICIVALYIRSWLTGKLPTGDAALPENVVLGKANV